MADDGEVDVLGDFDSKLEVDNAIYDANELPSKSANLLPEFTDPPWLLEQGWPLDSCMDEKSKATIEKMLLEEQFYINGKAPRSKQRLAVEMGQLRSIHGPVSTPLLNEEIRKSAWTKEEKDMFHKGMEVFGRSWTKIAELIPTRTSIQIKNFANQYFKQMEKEGVSSSSEVTVRVETPSTSKQLSDPLSVAMETVSTAEPTIPTRKRPIVPKLGRIPKKDKIKSPNLVKSSISFDSKNKTSKHKIKASEKSSKQGPMWKEKRKKFTNHTVTQEQSITNTEVRTSVENSLLETTVTITHDLIENLDGFCDVADIVTITTTEADDSDEDIDVDIEDDDDDNCNPLLVGRSISPNSVYEKLITEANMKTETDNGTDDSGQGLSEVEGNSSNRPMLHSEQVMNIDDKNVFDSSVETDKEHVGEITCTTARTTDNSTDNSNDNCLAGNLENGEKLDNVPVSEQSDAGQTMKMPERPPAIIQKVTVNACLTVDGDVVHFPFPTAEVVLKLNVLGEEEKDVMREFFENRPSKTPARYLRIRNYILECWRKSKPVYVNKTSVRSGLKSCGDVNSIGRVHAYLECIGAINFGCDQVAYKNPRPAFSLMAGRERVSKDAVPEVNVAKLEAMRPRKRKVKDSFGVWIDQRDLEGMTIIPEGTTIEHVKGLDSAKKEMKPKQPKQMYDPFKLIPCLSFSDDRPAPFSVEVHSSALMVMDIHSHIAKTEVIGMLGGRYCLERGKLTITMATPCNSISTGMQCEMDPVSQTQASEEIRCAAMDVVGWYHSHPSFNTRPSVRDIETQLKFQDWFSKGGSKFVGVIVSPYNPRNSSLSSEVNCLTVSDIIIPELKCNMPYKFDHTTVPCDSMEMTNVVMCAQDLASNYANFPNRIHLSSTFVTGITCLEKMLESLRSYSSLVNTEFYIGQIRDAFTHPGHSFTGVSKTYETSPQQISTDNPRPFNAAVHLPTSSSTDARVANLSHDILAAEQFLHLLTQAMDPCS